MGITFLEKEKLFKLDTPNTTYVLGIVGSEGFLGHAYYGEKIEDVRGVDALMRIYENPFTPDANARDRLSFLDCVPMEYSPNGVGDFRESSIRVKTKNGHSAVLLTYVSHEIYKGKEKPEGLPATFGAEDEVTTLAITCEDKVIGLKAILKYSTFE
mgnify:FL=1